MSTFFTDLPIYLGVSLHTLIFISSLKEFLIGLKVGFFNFRLLITANSLATPKILKQSPRFGVISNLIIESLPVILELKESYPSTSIPAIVSWEQISSVEIFRSIKSLSQFLLNCILKLFQESIIIFEEESQIRNVIFQHCHSFNT